MYNTKSWRGPTPQTENEGDSSERFSNIVTPQVGFGRTLVLGRCVRVDASGPALITITPTCRAGFYRHATGSPP